MNTYLQNGGGILSTGWFVHETQSIYNYGDLALITPYLDDGSYHFQSPGQMSIVQNDHEVTSGISNFFPTCNYTEYEISIDPGAEQLGGLIGVENANTIIVKDAQNFGLAQLYQIRGRVGRGGRQANCLLLVPKKKLDKPAQERLRTLEKNTALGSGYNISMSDLEIRGAGSLFGHRQSGHISTIGFHMYCDLLSLEVEKSQGSNPSKKTPPVIKTSKNLEIPDNYIQDPSFRIDYYYRVSCAKNLEEIEKIEKEILEIFW